MKDETAIDDRQELTEAERSVHQKYRLGFGHQDENGIDLASLRRNLRPAPAQRLTRLQQVVNTLPNSRASACH